MCLYSKICITLFLKKYASPCVMGFVCLHLKTCKADSNFPGWVVFCGSAAETAIKRSSASLSLLQTCSAIPSRLWFNAMPHTQMASCNPLHIFEAFWLSAEKEGIYSSDLPVAAICNMHYEIQIVLSLRSISQRFLYFGHTFFLVFLPRLVSLVDKIHITKVSFLWLQILFGVSLR